MQGHPDLAGLALMMLGRLSPSLLLRANIAALSLRPAERLEFADTLLLIGLHAAGLTALAVFFKLSWIIAVVVLSALVLLQIITRRSQVLAPFFFAYAALLIRLVYVHLLHGQFDGYYDYLLPDWGLTLVQVQAATLAAGIYSTGVTAATVLQSRRRAAWLTAIVLAGVTLTWAFVEYSGHRTWGTTGSDPYAYVQMGIDLATRGTVVHRFGLFPEIAPLKISWYPIVHVGYHLPMNELGDAVTVFPAGGALAFGIAYRLFGEPGLYWVNPLFSLLSILAAGLLAWELTRRHGATLRAMTAAITCALVATANQQVVWAGVTMVDAQAEFFSILSILFAVRTRDDKSIWTLILTGAALGAAYWVRHTQVVLAFCILAIFWMWNDTFGGRVRALLVSGGVALVLGIGDLWYHQTYLGGWLHPESEELALFSISAVSASATSLFQQIFAANEFGWTAPFLIYGAVKYAREARVESIALFAWIGFSLSFHLPYAAVRPRDLLPEFPAMGFLAAFGLCFLAAQLVSSHRMQWLSGFVVVAILELLLLRVWNTVPRVWQPAEPNFGYMTESQRAAFGQLAAITSQDAVIGSTLNDGAIELYSRRNTFRPDMWSSGERREFLAVVRSSHSTVYLLEDGEAMDGVLDDLRHDMLVRRVATLDVPLFGDAPVSDPGALWKIDDK